MALTLCSAAGRNKVMTAWKNGEMEEKIAKSLQFGSNRSLHKRIKTLKKVL
jgi:hypothetical protein